MKCEKIILTGLVVAILACGACIVLMGIGLFFGRNRLANNNANLIGFNFTGRTAQFPMGDIGAGRTLFIHHYPVPQSGHVIGFKYSNDYENGNPEKQEEIVLLLLRPEINDWSIFYRYETVDDNPVRTEGVTTVLFPLPVAVERGDIFATYQPDLNSSGAIPMNSDQKCVEGKSSGRFGFDDDQIQVNLKIQNQGFTGCRDYFIDLLFVPN
jgi:hypothetical protein